MTNFLDKYSLDQSKLDSLYQVLIKKLNLDKEGVKNFLVNIDEASLIRALSKYHFSAIEISDIIVLYSYELAEANAQNIDNHNAKIGREFKQESLSTSRNYFTPAGNYQSDINGLITNGNTAICGSSCSGVITGKFLALDNTDSMLSYKYTPNQGFSYTISSINKDRVTSYISNVLNTLDLQTLGTSNIRVDAIDVNYDGLDDVVISVTDSSFDKLPVVLLNDKDSSFSASYQLSDCSSSNGAIKVSTGYFFGTHQPGGLWCQNTNNNIGLFYQIDIKSSENLLLKTAVSNWCVTSMMAVLDYNGDKYDDALCIGASQQQLFVSNYGQMVSATASGTGNLALFSINDINSAKFVTGDFDGNGKDDILRMDNVGNFYLYLSNGKTFFDYKKGKENNNNAIEIGNGEFCTLSSHLLSGKFNNDQKSDLWCSSSNSDRFMLSTLESDKIHPKVKMLVTYTNFNLNVPSDLSSYSIELKTSKNFVNALDQGAISYNVPLELNIETTSYLDSFKKDITLTNPVVSGKVNYVPQYDEYNKIISTSNLQGYVLDINRNPQLEFDLMMPPEKVSANILSPWNRINLHDNVNFSVYPNKCVTAQLRSFIYKDISSFYTATGVVTLLDGKDIPLSGQRLLETAQSIINKPVSLTKSGQAVFNTTGNMLFSLPYNVESAVLPCSTLSSLQTISGLPKVIVKLTYDSFAFTAPNLAGVSTKTITSQERLKNNKQYGQTTISKAISLEVQLSQKIDGFSLDMRTNDLVKDGEVIYMKGFNDIQLTTGQDLSGYRVDISNKDYLKHSWMTPASRISAELFSDWNTFKIISEAEVTLVPGQCSLAKIEATLYQNVPFAYTARGHFSATDESGYPITGDTLLAVAQNVLSKDVSIDSLGEGVFSTTGTLTRNLVANVITDIDDC